MNRDAQPHAPVASIGRRRASGFTLLEITLAVLIFAVVVTGMVTAIDRAGEAIGGGMREVRARAAIEARLAELRANPASPMPEQTGPLHLTESIEPAALSARDGTPLEGLFTVRITAAWESMSNPPDPLVLEEIVPLAGQGGALP